MSTSNNTAMMSRDDDHDEFIGELHTLFGEIQAVASTNLLAEDDNAARANHLLSVIERLAAMGTETVGCLEGWFMKQRRAQK